MKIERMQMNIGDVLKHLLSKWKMMLIIVVISMGFFVGCMELLCKVTMVPASEDYITYQKKVETLQEYIDNSKRMEIDSTAICQRRLMLHDITDYSLLKDYVVTGNVWGDYVDEIPVQCLTELIAWESGEDAGEATLLLIDSTAEGCMENAQYLKNQLLNYDENLSVVIGEETLVADVKLLEEQELNYSLLKELKNNVKSANNGYREGISVASAAIFGLIVGGMIAVVIAFSQYVFSKKIRNIEELELYTKTKIVGKIPNIFNDILVPEVTSSVFDVVLKEQLKDFGKIVLINMTESTLAVKGIQEVDASQIMQDENAYAKVISADAVMLAAGIEKTGYKELEDIVEFLDRNEKKICGCIAC